MIIYFILIVFKLCTTVAVMLHLPTPGLLTTRLVPINKRRWNLLFIFTRHECFENAYY